MIMYDWVMFSGYLQHDWPTAGHSSGSGGDYWRSWASHRLKVDRPRGEIMKDLVEPKARKTLE